MTYPAPPVAFLLSASGAPTTGTYVAGQWGIDQTGTIWICVAGGTPGTWLPAGGWAGDGSGDSAIQGGIAVFGDINLAGSLTAGGYIATDSLANASLTPVSSGTALDDNSSYLIILCDASGGAFTLTLTDATNKTGVLYLIKQTDSSANAVTLATVSSQTIDGAATLALGALQAVTLTSDGANWLILGSHG